MPHRYAATVDRRSQLCRGSRWLVLVALLGLMAGCRPGSGSEPEGSAAPAGESSGSPASVPASLELASPRPSGSSPIGTYAGRLGSDAIEGGCTYLESDDGRRYEVIYPDGWELRRSPFELVDPGGRVVATAGDRITIRGTEADMVSVCQIGPIIQAIEVTPS
jgi:hypothetical protein